MNSPITKLMPRCKSISDLTSENVDTMRGIKERAFEGHDIEILRSSDGKRITRRTYFFHSA